MSIIIIINNCIIPTLSIMSSFNIINCIISTLPITSSYYIINCIISTLSITSSYYIINYIISTLSITSSYYIINCIISTLSHNSHYILSTYNTLRKSKAVYSIEYISLSINFISSSSQYSHFIFANFTSSSLILKY